MPERAPFPDLLAAAAFAVLLAAGLGAASVSLDELDGRELGTIAEPAAWWSGEAARIVTRKVNDEFAPRKAFHRVERSLAWLALRDWGPRVREGCPGWLFLEDELESHAGAYEAAQVRARIAGRLSARLAREGVQLLVAVVPDKSRIESSHLCGLARAPHTGERAANWVRRLREQGVAVVDLTDTLARLPGERYYPSDTHWNERGAEAAAKAIAAALRGRGLAAPLQAEPAPLPPKTIERPGDLVRVAGLDALPRGLGPAPDTAELRAVPPVASASDDLFGEAALPKVVVVGTSFSRTSNLVPFLARHLGEQVANAAKDGADFDGAAAAYVASAGFRESRPKAVVWEIPERAIEPPVKPSERDWMKTLAR